MNNLIELLDQALQANLSKRQWAVFAAVLRQTFGFRKTADDISPRRLAQLTGVQRNHIWQAKKELEAIGLLQSRPGTYGDILSFSRGTEDSRPARTAAKTPVAKAAMAKQDSPPIPPPLSTKTQNATRSASPPIPPPLPPETGQHPPKTGQHRAQIRTEGLPKQDTTHNNLTGCNHHTVSVADSATLRYPAELSPVERRQAPLTLDGLSPQAAQQVLDVWAYKIQQGEVRRSRLGLLSALVTAQRQNTLDTRCLGSHPPAAALPEDAQFQQRQQAREHWLEQQAQQAWLRDMQHFGVSVSGLKPPVFSRSGGV